MALTFTLSGDWQTVEGSRRKSRGTLAFDSSYPTGGESFTAAMVGLGTIERVAVTPTNGYYFEYDNTNSLLKVFKTQSQGIISSSVTTTNSVSTGNQDLITYSLPASVLSVNGMGVRIKAWGWHTSTAATKSIRVLVGTGYIAATHNLQISTAGSWNMETDIYRTAAATQKSVSTFHYTNGGLSGTGTSSNVVVNYPNMTLTSAQTIGTGCSANAAAEVVQEGQIIELLVPTGTGTVGVEVESTADLSGLSGVRFEATGY